MAAMTRHDGHASFSPCETYRYELGGSIGPEEPLLASVMPAKQILWIMLNPSKADAMHDDPTIRTIVGYSERWSYNTLVVGNLYAYRATKPKDMWAAQKKGRNIVGLGNDDVLRKLATQARERDGIVMAAWGADAEPSRVKAVCEIVGPMSCLGRNGDGSPWHPLYHPVNLRPVEWTPNV